MATRSTSPVVALLLLASVACSGDMSIEDARTATVASVDGVTLDGATLEQVLLATPAANGGPTREAAALVTSVFIDAALLRGALLRGDSLTDSATVRAAVLPDAIRGNILSLLQRRAALMPPVTDEQADSLGRLGGVRVLQHVLLRVADFSDSLEGLAVRDRASALLRQVNEDGADFAAIARRLSEDSSTARNGGYLPAVRRSDLPPQRWADAAWELAPGETSRLVISEAGVHVIRRPTLVEARDGLRQWLVPALTRQADSAWVDSLSRAKGVTLAGDAVRRMRQLGLEPFTGGGDAPFATWQGGELTADETRMWVSVLPMLERAALAGAPDTGLTMMLEQLAERDLVQEATGVADPITVEAWSALAPQFRAAVSAVSEGSRDALVTGDSSTAVRLYLHAVSTGTRPYRPLPGTLGALLRRGHAVEVNQRALDAVVTAAARQWQVQQGDSTRADSAN